MKARFADRKRRIVDRLAGQATRQRQTLQQLQVASSTLQPQASRSLRRRSAARVAEAPERTTRLVSGAGAGTEVDTIMPLTESHDKRPSLETEDAPPRRGAAPTRQFRSKHYSWPRSAKFGGRKSPRRSESKSPRRSGGRTPRRSGSKTPPKNSGSPSRATSPSMNPGGDDLFDSVFNAML